LLFLSTSYTHIAFILTRGALYTVRYSPMCHDGRKNKLMTHSHASWGRYHHTLDYSMPYTVQFGRCNQICKTPIKVAGVTLLGLVEFRWKRSRIGSGSCLVVKFYHFCYWLTGSFPGIVTIVTNIISKEEVAIKLESADIWLPHFSMNLSVKSFERCRHPSIR